MSRPDLESRLLPALRACSGQRLCVAYSGGLDSTVLLHLLARLAPEAGCSLFALHVHHGLSPNADDWAAHCETECAALGVPLRVERVQLVRDAGKGLEAAAREARHAVFATLDADWLLLAHHANDQAETLLHRLVRGTGLAGLAGMRERDASRRLWRPLLAEPRAALEAWAVARGLVWVEDESNADHRFTRNYLRHAVLPALVSRQPAAVGALTRAAGHFAEAEELLTDLARLDAAAVRLGQADARRRLRDLSPARARNLLRYWLGEAGELAPDAARLEHARRALCGEAALREVFAAHALCAYRGRVWLEAARLGVAQAQPWRGQAELAWAGGRLRFVRCMGAGLAAEPAEPAEAALELRPRRGGEQMRLAENRPRRSFKALCQEAGLPVWWRDEIPLLWRGDELLWIGGVGVAAEAAAAPGRPGWLIEWCGPDGCWRG